MTGFDSYLVARRMLGEFCEEPPTQPQNEPPTLLEPEYEEPTLPGNSNDPEPNLEFPEGILWSR